MPNFRISDDSNLASGGMKTRAQRNIVAIEHLKSIEEQSRQATPEEQVVLSQYVGWGGIPQIFNPTPDPDWANLAARLKEILDGDEYSSAFESVLNAHYTSGAVIGEIYQGLERLGFTGGRILEPSMGVGNFLGLMPEQIARRSEVTGIELDSITGRIAQLLYPNHEIYVQGFEKTVLPKDYFDLAISNVPFGDYKINDPEYNALDLRIHNYFFARSLDQVRPGGLVCFITSTGTMQSQSGKAFRAWMSERANLVGAMRLPGDAFKTNAGTEVTTDLIILQKLGAAVELNHQPWIDLAPTEVQDADGNYLKTNEYYVRNPQCMLGDLCDDKLHPGRLALRSNGQNLSESMQQAFTAFPASIYQRSISPEPELDTVRVKIPPGTGIKNYGYLAQGEVLWQRQDAWLYPAEVKGKTADRIIGMIEIRDAVQEVFEVQIRGGSDWDLAVIQEKLNQVYDRFIDSHGYLTDTANLRAFSADPDAQLLQALEKRGDNKEILKSDIFSKRTVRPRVIKAQASTAQEALINSLNEYGRIVPGYMASLLGTDEAPLLNDLNQQGLVFLDPATRQWQTQDQYLAGDVREKLKIAQEQSQEDERFQPNVKALEGVQPRDLGPGEIEVRLGASWVPPEVIADFAHDLLEIDPSKPAIEVGHNSKYAVWGVDVRNPLARHNARNTTTFGTEYITALELLELSLNLKDATVYYRTADDQQRIDQEPTLAARLKQQQIQEQFKNWVWQDFDRSEKLCRIYNDVFNGTVVRQFSNPNLEMPGSNPEIELRPHQKDAVWRMLQSDTTLLAHVVGAGKTFEMIAGAIEMRRLGIAQKPMIVVPNHMLGQFTRELYQLYPNAKVLAPSEKDTQAAKRKELMARIATGDWDAVVVTHSAFTRLPISETQRQTYFKEQLNEIDLMLGDQDVKQSNGVVKFLARERKKLQERVDKITENKIKDDGVTFEQLGIDALFVDEAHFWKNLGRSSKLQNIAGLSNTNSLRAIDAFMKCRIVRANGGRLVFATGTPVSNSIAELYTMQRFLQPEALKRQGIENFDSWVGTFAEKVTAPEIDPTGRFKVKTRLTRFTNVPELMTLFREVADIKTAEQLNLPRPAVERITLASGSSPLQLKYMERLIERAEAVAARKVEPNEDNMLWVTTDGRRASLDPRLISNSLPDYPESKVNQAIANIHAIWKVTESQKLSQMVFCDLGTPKAEKEEIPFSIYQHVKDVLVARGVPANEIAFIHDAAKSKDKELLFAAVRQGKVRVLIGSTEKCGVGMNVQDRLIAEHHLDPPWRPSDIEQREGRILRQGNRNQKVAIFTYVTQGREGQLGFDSYSWQTLARKAEMVAQVMNGDSAIRAVDDISSSALSFDEVKAIATGNPLIIEKATVDNRISELSRYKQAFLNERHTIQRRISSTLPHDIEYSRQRIEALKTDIARRVDTRGDLFAMKIGKHDCIKREAAGKLLQGIIAQIEMQNKRGEQIIGKFAGFDLVVSKLFNGVSFQLASPSGMFYPVKGGDTPLGIIRSIENTLNKLPEQLEENNSILGLKQKEIETLQTTQNTSFDYEEELARLLVRQQEINGELGLNKSDQQSLAVEGGAESKVENSEIESEDQLIDLDSLVSADAAIDWTEAIHWDQTQLLCEPSPELVELLGRINEFIPVETIKGDRIPGNETVSPVPSQEQPELTAKQEEDLESLRRWYHASQGLERPYLSRIEEIALEIKHSGTSLSTEAQTIMDRDLKEYQKRISKLIQDAQSILKKRGQQSPSGAIVYSGQTYTVAEARDGSLSVRSQNRGEILHLNTEGVKSLKLVKQDFVMFDGFAQKLQQERKQVIRR
jgi:N12 class adenine-specific DNA methylase